MQSILLSNFVTLSLIAGLAVLIFTNKSFDRRTNRYFMLFVVIVLLLDIADMVDYYVSSFATVSMVRYVTTALGYVLRNAALAALISILLRSTRKNRRFIWIPIAVLAVLVCIPHLVFSFDAGNNFKRGPLGILPFIVAACYSIVLIVLTFKSYQRLGRGEMIIMIYIVLLSLFATALEVFSYTKFLLPGAYAVSCALYYIFLYIETYRRDSLTGLLNRRSLYSDVERLLSTGFNVISVDLNGLKDINDSSGHQSGDEALQALANALLKAANDSSRVYRTGGDEFIVISRHETPEAYIAQAQEELRKSGYMASFGFAVYSKGCSFDAVCNQADRMMYKDKFHYHHRVSKCDADTKEFKTL